MADHSKDSLLRLPEVKRRTGLSTATIYRKMGTADFPRSRQLSINIVAWYESEIDAWVADPMGWKQARAA
jgi:prophage regulatory protein